MLAFTCVALLLVLLGLAPLPAVAQDAQALRRELDQVKKQFETMQQEYLKTIESLSQRLQRLESQPAAPTPPPVAAPPAPPAVAQPAPPGPPSLVDLARPRQPFGLYTTRGPGQFLFDIGIAGDFVANLTQDAVDRADAGTFAGRENRVFPREIELGLFGQIDPYARGEVRIEAAEEFEDGARLIEVGLAEAHLTLLTLPFGTQAKLGLMRNRFGLLNERHQHDLPFIDRPNVLVRFFGEEQIVESGLEATWVPPLPFYLEVLGGIFNGDNEVAFGRGSLRHPLLTGRVRTFFELGPAGAIQLGVSAARGTAPQTVTLNDFGAGTTVDETTDTLRSIFLGFDLKYKFTPDGWRHPLLTFGGEAIHARRRALVVGDPDGDGIESAEIRTRKRFGWYAYGEVQPWKRWLGGVRYDSTQFLVNPGREWAVGPYITFMPSEFLRFRLGYKHTERFDREGFNPEAGAGIRSSDEIFVQGTFILGAHPAHPF